jgi:hypothetical protein
LTSVLLLFQNDDVKSDKLESLSLEALYALADKMGLDLPPGLERLFVVEEIIEAMVEDSEDRRATGSEAVHIDEKKYSGSGIDDFDAPLGESPSLELRYNETVIHALVRDPSWAFAYWDIADGDRAAVKTDESDSHLFLRVAELGPDGEESHKEYFDIPVSDEDLQWYINLPRPGVRFRIDLCARPGGKRRVLARSNEVVSPRQSLQPGQGFDHRAAELLRISGIERLHIEVPTDANPRRILPTDTDRAAGDGA